MDDQKNEAERLRLGVLGGWLAVDEAVAFADRQIECTSKPHAAFLELALAGRRSRAEVAALLGAVPGSADSTAVMRRCFSDLLEVVEREPRLAADAARWLEAAAIRGQLPEAAFGLDAFDLAEEFELAQLGVYGTFVEARQGLVRYLRQHSTHEA